MNTDNPETTLRRLIKIAREREMNDDHLSSDMRREVLNAYRCVHPGETLSEDLDEAYVEVVFG